MLNELIRNKYRIIKETEKQIENFKFSLSFVNASITPGRSGQFKEGKAWLIVLRRLLFIGTKEKTRKSSLSFS